LKQISNAPNFQNQAGFSDSEWSFFSVSGSVAELFSTCRLVEAVSWKVSSGEPVYEGIL
jgi:hypothetical protein